MVSDLVQPVRSVRNMCIQLDSDLWMNTDIARTASSCFAVLRQIRSISRSVSQAVVQSLIVSLAGLLLCDAGLPSCMSARQTSVCSERCGTSDLQVKEIRSRHAAATRPSLVADPGTNHVSMDDISVPLSE
jgi:hypothetical protein